MNAAAAPDNYEPPISDHALPASNRSAESQLTARLQHLTTNSYSTRAANSNSVFDPHFSPLSSGDHLTSTNSPDFRSPLGTDQVAAWQETSFLDLPIESADHGRQSALLAASRSTSNNSGATKEGDAPISESDDSELIALTNTSDVDQLPPVENRYFLPQGILGGGQQECAEFNMWRWPWVNSVQLLRQEPHQPQLTNESSDEFPQYQMWNMPLVNVVNSQHQVSAHTPQQPAASAESLLLLTPSLRSDASLIVSSEYNLWSSPKLVDVEQLSSMDRQSAETNNTATNPMPSHDNVCTAGVQFPPFVPIIRGRVTFSNRGAFHYYRRQPPLPDGGSMENLQMRIQSSVEQFHFSAPEPVSSYANDELEADKEVHNLTDEDQQSALAPPDSQYLFRPLAPAFKVSKDMQPLMLRSASGLEYQQNGHKLFVFKHELDAKSNNPYLFQPKYAVSLNDKGCQTEPELLYTCAVTNVSCSPFPVHREPSTTSHIAHPRLSPNLAASQGWPQPQHHQPACQPAPQRLWSSYQPAASAAAAVPSTSQPWPQFPSPSQPSPPFWTAAQQPNPQTWAAEPLQYYSLNDVFSHLGQPGFANVGEYDSPLAMTFSST